MIFSGFYFCNCFLLCANQMQTLSTPHQDASSLSLGLMRRWIVCFCVVNFDLAIGQTVERSLPINVFTDSEFQNIANLSFPDSNSGLFHDTTFTFRFRSQSGGGTKMSSRYPFYFGYVFFRQQKDASIRRGYFQKSIVLISHLPLNFEPICKLVGTMYFDCGETALESAVNSIASWPNPIPSLRMLDLPCLGELFEMHIDPLALASVDDSVKLQSSSQFNYVSAKMKPKIDLVDSSSVENSPSLVPTAPSFLKDSTSTAFQQAKSLSLNVSLSRMGNPKFGLQPIATKRAGNLSGQMQIGDVLSKMHAGAPGIFQHVNVFNTFSSVLPSLWHFWELSITSSTLLFLSKTPSFCSNAVLGIVSLISPIIYRSDYRPYFTIYDPDFRFFQNSSHSSVVLGTTNPFFLKALGKCPTVVHLSESNIVISSRRDFKLRDESISVEEIAPGQIMSTQEPLLAVNNVIMNQLMAVPPNPSDAELESISGINNTILRRHFFELTNQFLSPFQRYFSPVNQVMNGNESFNPFLHPPTLPIFKEYLFLEELEDYREQLGLLTASGLEWRAVAELYLRFFRSPHFYPWFNRQVEEARENLERRIETLIRYVDMKALMNSMPVRQALCVLESVQTHLSRIVHRNEKSTYDKELMQTLVDFRVIILNSLPESIRASVAAANPLPTEGSGKYYSFVSPTHASSLSPVSAGISETKSAPLSPFVPSPSLAKKFPVAVVDNFF